MYASRKKLTFAFSVVAAILATASVAYACIPFKGKLTVTVPAGRTQGSTVVGDGSTTNLQYCASPDGRASVAGTAGGGDQITVTVAAATSTDCTTPGASQLTAATNYSVRMNNADGATTAPFTFDATANKWVIQAGTGCFKSPTPSTVITIDNGTFTVGSNGAGSEAYTLPPMNTTNGPGRASSLCVGKPADSATGYLGEGIFAPLQIVAL